MTTDGQVSLSSPRERQEACEYLVKKAFPSPPAKQ